MCVFIAYSCIVIPCGWINFYWEFHPRLYYLSILIGFRFYFFNYLKTYRFFLGKYNSIERCLLEEFQYSCNSLEFFSFMSSTGVFTSPVSSTWRTLIPDHALNFLDRIWHFSFLPIKGIIWMLFYPILMIIVRFYPNKLVFTYYFKICCKYPTTLVILLIFISRRFCSKF